MMIWLNNVRRKNLDYDSLTPAQQVKGLSYVEVMVSMLTSALFLSTTLQAYVAATGIKAKSQQMNTAIASIQADVETIRHIAQVVPQACQLPASGSYVQQIMENMGSVEQVGDHSILQQASILPIDTLPDYKLRRVLSLDKLEGPSYQVLQISYQVLRQSSQVLRQSSSSESMQRQTEENADQPQLASTQTETPLAQLHTSILPNAALVCF
jgi:hypothetical protein